MTDFKKIAQDATGAPPPRPASRGPKTEKPAAEPHPAPASTTDSTVPARGKAGPTANPVSGGVGSSSLPAVKEMQQAILNFASVAASTDVTSMKGNQYGKQTGEQDRKVHSDGLASPNPHYDPADPTSQDQLLEERPAVDINEKEHLGGSDPFGDFIVQQYVANDPRGSQYLNTDVGGKKGRGNASIDNSNLRGLIDTISRVGTPGVNGGEKSVDGVWAYRTDHALQGISIITKAMLDFARDLKVPVRYTEQNYEDFAKAIPKSYTELKNPAEKTAKAKFLTSHINAISGFFKELKKEILNNREHRQYIDQKKPFVQYKQNVVKTPKELLDPTELSTFNTNQILPLSNVGFVGVNNRSNSISLRELSDMESFKGFMKRIGKGKESENPAEVKKMLDTVMQQLSASDVTPSSQGAGY